MLGPVNTASQVVLDKIARSPRFGDIEFEWTSGWHETGDRAAGFFRAASATPSTLDDVIFQGPHFTVANPFARRNCSGPSRRGSLILA